VEPLAQVRDGGRDAATEELVAGDKLVALAPRMLEDAGMYTGPRAPT
jgi:hypothetical protein